MQGLAYLTEHYPKLSYAQACRIVNCTRSSKYYQKKMPKKDEPIQAAIMSVIGYSRKGRNKVIALVRKRYPQYGSSQIRRVYEQSGFSLSKKLGRRIKDKVANPLSIPFKENIEWALDFMSDSLMDGTRIRTLNIVDHYNRLCTGVKVAKNFPSRMVIDYLEQRIALYGKPQSIRTDNGPEFRSKLFQKWLHNRDIQWSRIQKGKPQQNAIIERFNKTYREDILDAHLFKSVEEANEITHRWVQEYNNERPHQALNYQTPSAYAI